MELFESLESMDLNSRKIVKAKDHSVSRQISIMANDCVFPHNDAIMPNLFRAKFEKGVYSSSFLNGNSSDGGSFGGNNVSNTSSDSIGTAVTVPIDADEILASERNFIDFIDAPSSTERNLCSCRANDKQHGLLSCCSDVDGHDQLCFSKASYDSSIDHCFEESVNSTEVFLTSDCPEQVSTLDDICKDGRTTFENVASVSNGPYYHCNNNSSGFYSLDGFSKGSVCAQFYGSDFFQCPLVLGRGAFLGGLCIIGPLCKRRDPAVELLGTQPVVKVKRYKVNDDIFSKMLLLVSHCVVAKYWKVATGVIDKCWKVATFVLAGLTPHIVREDTGICLLYTSPSPRDA